MDHLLRHAPAGMRRAEVIAVFTDGLRWAAEARGVPLLGTVQNISVGPSPWGSDGLLEPGALVKVDTTCNIGGYNSDCARTFCLGEPHPVAAEIYAVLREAFEVGIAMFRPGVVLADIHARVLGTIRRSGFAGFSRRHFGHGIGSSVWGRNGLKFWGISPSLAFVAESETNGVIERFFRTLKGPGHCPGQRARPHLPEHRRGPRRRPRLRRSL